MTVPSWTKHWKVDEVIECVTGIDEATRTELLKVAPRAYDGAVKRVPIDGIEGSLCETVVTGGVKMSTAWPKLPIEVRRHVDRCYQAEYKAKWGEEDR